MDDPDITMEEYIKLEEEKAQKCGKVSVETEFPAIAFNDEVSSKALSCEPTISSLNNEINFRISFDNSDDEGYTVIFEKNSFSYKKISTNDLKTDSKNDNEKVMPSLPSPKPVISCFDDLDFFKNFENEFSAIVYNDALTSKSDLLIEPILNPQHVDEVDLNNETSLSKYNEEEQNILYFNDLLHFNVIHPNDLKSDEDNDDNEINIIQSSEDMAPLPPHEQRHPFLRYQGLEYSDANIADFKERLERIYSREIHRVQVVDFQGMPELVRDGLFARIVMEHRDDAVLRLYHRMMAHNIAGRSQAPEKVTMTDLFYLRGLDVGSVNILYLLARYLRRFAAGKKSGAHISGGQFVAGLAEHFGLLTAKILGGLTVIAPELSIIDMGELVRLQICMEVDDSWAWVAMGPERQPDAAAVTPVVAEDVPAVDEGKQAVPTPMQAPQQPPPPPPAVARTMPQRLGRLEE
ncbi:hypothetical protein Tco_1390474 [Tanacetum coccineum]